MRAMCALLVAATASGCFWGDVDAGVRLTVSEGNLSEYESVLYPRERVEAWTEIFADRQPVCPPDDEGCDDEDRERTDLLSLPLPYDTDRARGLLTSKGDLQLTAHFQVGDAFAAAAEDSFGYWAELSRADRVWGVEGDGCGPEIDPLDRTGVGRCLRAEVEANLDAYEALDDDLRFVMLINLPGEDDVRSTACQDAPRTFESSDWEYPRTLFVDYNATQPGETADGSWAYGFDTAPLPQCERHVYTRLSVGVQVFSGDYYGFGDTDHDLTLDLTNEGLPDEDMLLGSVELTALSLPREGGDARATGRFRSAFTSSRFSTEDGVGEIRGSFDVEVRDDAQQVDDPERDIDLDATGADP